MNLKQLYVKKLPIIKPIYNMKSQLNQIFWLPNNFNIQLFCTVFHKTNKNKLKNYNNSDMKS